MQLQKASFLRYENNETIFVSGLGIIKTAIEAKQVNVPISGSENIFYPGNLSLDIHVSGSEKAIKKNKH